MCMCQQRCCRHWQALWRHAFSFHDCWSTGGWTVSLHGSSKAACASRNKRDVSTSTAALCQSDEAAPHLLAQHECVGCVDQHLELSVVFDAPDAHHRATRHHQGRVGPEDEAPAVCCGGMQVALAVGLQPVGPSEREVRAGGTGSRAATVVSGVGARNQVSADRTQGMLCNAGCGGR